MNNMGKFIFLHFEKALLVVIFVGLAYSLIWFGPWRGLKDYDDELEKLRTVVENTERIDGAPAVPDLAAALQVALVAPQAGVSERVIWPLKELGGNFDVLPPADVVLRPERGYVRVNWQLNTNQSLSADTLQLIGVQIDRAVVGSKDQQEDYENRTKVAADREYMTPTELSAIAQKVVAVTLRQEQAAVARTRGPGVRSAEAPYSIDDLFNALHDGFLTVSSLRSLVTEMVRGGMYNAEDRNGVNETFMVLRMVINESRRATRSSGARSNVRVSDEDLLKLALEEIGYRGGGKYVADMKRQEMGTTLEFAATVDSAPAASEQAAKPPESGPVPVPFAEVTAFVDTAVNPDLEYKYRVRFWALDRVGPTPELRSSEFVTASGVASPKPDTEFFFTGIWAEQGKASIIVRKWMYASNNWELKSYFVAPGDQIGGVEVVPKRDTAGRILTEGGKVVSEPIDFSTGCVLLDVRIRPKTFENKITSSRSESGQIITVDSVYYVLYDTPQIVFSDRKGVLRVKWKASAEES